MFSLKLGRFILTLRLLFMENPFIFGLTPGYYTQVFPGQRKTCFKCFPDLGPKSVPSSIYTVINPNCNPGKQMKPLIASYWEVKQLRLIYGNSWHITFKILF